MRFEELSWLEGELKETTREYVLMTDMRCVKCGSAEHAYLGQYQERARDEAGAVYYVCRNGHVNRH